jgi:hypothetical protein
MSFRRDRSRHAGQATVEVVALLPLLALAGLAIMQLLAAIALGRSRSGTD